MRGLAPAGPKLDEDEPLLVALCCNEAPLGKARRSMLVLAGRLVELRVVETISDETVRIPLKKIRAWLRT